MAGNTIRPAAAGPPRTNTVRPRPEEVPPASVASEPVAEATPVPEPVAPPAAPRPRKPAAPAPLTADEAEAQASEWQRTQRASPRSSWSLFSLLDRFTSFDGLFREGLPVRYLPKLLFVMLLTLLYIGNTHYGNRMNRNIQRLKQETEDLRADYTTLKSDYMEASKQSEVARKVAAIGLVESSSPPFRIAVPAGHLDEAELETMPVLTADTLAARALRDSLASHRADSLQGQLHRQLGPTTDADDSSLELGAPPPGVADEDAGPAEPRTDLPNKTLYGKKEKGTRSKKKSSSIKKSIKVQGPAAKQAVVKPSAKKRVPSNEKQR